MKGTQTATPIELIDKLTYMNYKHNRRLDTTLPSDWYPIYGRQMVDEMERRYQKERHPNVHPVFHQILKGISGGCQDTGKGIQRGACQ